MDIFDIFLDILLKPSQPLMGQFFCLLAVMKIGWDVRMFETSE